jgi:hypothetical protein
MQEIRATARYTRAAHAVAELLDKLRIEGLFVGNVARSAWLGGTVAAGSVDVLAMMNAPQKGQLAMMASHRGFRVEQEELDQTEELDLVPLWYADPEGEVRVHVLLATNALYGRIMRAGCATDFGGRSVRVPAAEDLALLLLLADDMDGVKQLAGQDGFDHTAWQDRLASIGLSEAASLG